MVDYITAADLAAYQARQRFARATLQTLRTLTPIAAGLLVGLYALMELAVLFGTRGSVELPLKRDQPLGYYTVRAKSENGVETRASRRTRSGCCRAMRSATPPPSE